VSPTEDVQVAIGFFNAFSSMGMSITGNTNGTALDVNMNYSLVYASATTYKVNANLDASGGLSQVTIWVQKSGLVSAMYIIRSADYPQYEGKNLTNKIYASNPSFNLTTYLVTLLAPLETYNQFASQVVSASSYFHSTGTSMATIGTNTFRVTNYTTNTQDVAVESCSGVSYSLTKYVLSLGTPTGSSFQIMPYMEIAGTLITPGPSGPLTTPFEYTVQTTEFTLA